MQNLTISCFLPRDKAALAGLVKYGEFEYTVTEADMRDATIKAYLTSAAQMPSRLYVDGIDRAAVLSACATALAKIEADLAERAKKSVTADAALVDWLAGPRTENPGYGWRDYASADIAARVDAAIKERDANAREQARRESEIREAARRKEVEAMIARLNAGTATHADFHDGSGREWADAVDAATKKLLRAFIATHAPDALEQFDADELRDGDVMQIVADAVGLPNRIKTGFKHFDLKAKPSRAHFATLKALREKLKALCPPDDVQYVEHTTPDEDYDSGRTKEKRTPAINVEVNIGNRNFDLFFAL